jgi:hypothetical protein
MIPASQFLESSDTQNSTTSKSNGTNRSFLKNGEQSKSGSSNPFSVAQNPLNIVSSSGQNNPV